MAGRLARCAMRWGVTPVQTAFSSIRRPAGDVAHLILSGPSVADIGYSELDLPAVMGVNGSIALRRSHPHLRFAYYAMLDAGFVSRRRDLVADVLAQDLLLFVTPEVLRGIAQLFSPDDIRCRIAVFEEVHQRAYLPARSRNNWRGRCVTTRIWCCSTPMRRSIRWVSAWIRPEGSSAAARWPIAPCNCWSGWDFARSICMVWTCAERVFRRVSTSPPMRACRARWTGSSTHTSGLPFATPAGCSARAACGSTTCRPAAPWTSVFPKRHWTTLKRHALPS